MWNNDAIIAKEKVRVKEADIRLGNIKHQEISAKINKD